jgi:hypothetical protein
MPNPYGVTLDPAAVRWAIAEGMPETVIAAVLLLDERSVDEVASKLRQRQLEHVIRLVRRITRSMDAEAECPWVIRPRPRNSSCSCRARAVVLASRRSKRSTIQSIRATKIAGGYCHSRRTALGQTCGNAEISGEDYRKYLKKALPSFGLPGLLARHGISQRAIMPRGARLITPHVRRSMLIGR